MQQWAGFISAFILHVSGASAHHQEYLKLVRRPLVHVLSLQVRHQIYLLGPELNFISGESLYMFRASSVHHQEYLKRVQRPLVHVLSLQVSHHISLLGPKGPNKEM